MGWTSDKIRTLREALGLSRERFAHEVGVTANTVYRWEKKGVVPRSLAVLRKLEELEENAKREGKIS